MANVAGSYRRQKEKEAQQAVGRGVRIVLLLSLAMGIVWAPKAALAQSTSFDPTTEATAQRAAAQVGEWIRPGAASSVVSIPEAADTPADESADSEAATGSASEEDDARDSGVQTARPRASGSTDGESQPEDPQAEGTQDSEPTQLPDASDSDAPDMGLPEIELPEDANAEDDESDSLPDITDRAIYASDGMTVEAPAGWDVQTGVGPTTLFEMYPPDEDLFLMVEQVSDGSELEFPGLFMMGVLGFGELLAAQLGGAVELVGSSVGTTDQGVPYHRYEYSGDIEGIEAGVLFYLLSPGKEAFMVAAFAPIGDWEEHLPAIELIVNSMRFAPDKVTLERAPDHAPMPYTTASETISLTLPSGWYLTETDDPEAPLVLADADFDYTAILMAEPLLAEEWEAELAEVILSEAGEIDAEVLNEIVDILLDTLDTDEESIQLDPDRRDVFTRAGAITVRFTGSGDFEDLLMNLIGYVELRPEGGVVLLVLGDVEAGLADEPQLLDLLESVRFTPNE